MLKKILIITTLTTLTLTIDECILGITLKPLQYNHGFNNVELHIIFKSNCLTRPALIIFMTPFDESFEMTSSFHPKKAQISVLGRVFNFNFSEANSEETEGGVNVKYGKVIVEPADLSSVDTLKENNVLLRTSGSDRFKLEEVESLFFANNPCLCGLINDKTTIFCEV